MHQELFTIPELFTIGDFSVGNFTIYTYGFMMMIGFICSVAVLIPLGKMRGFTQDELLDYATTAIFLGLIGSRIGYVLEHPIYYFQEHPEEILNFRKGGMTVMGGVTLAGSYLLYKLYQDKKPIGDFFDVFSAPTTLGMAIGRIGCLLHGCCYGDLCSPDVPFALTFEQLAHQGLIPGPRYPVQLYEFGLDLVLFFLLLDLFLKKKLRGKLVFIFLAGYGMIRFFTESFRGDNTDQMFAGYSLFQWISLSWAIVAIIYLTWSSFRETPEPEK